MHTFELSCNISPVSYQYLHDKLPLLKRVSDYVERTNYYSAKGITQIELRTYEYAKYGVLIKRYYLVIRCNPSIVLGDSKIFLVNLEIDFLVECMIKYIYNLKNELYNAL